MSVASGGNCSGPAFRATWPRRWPLGQHPR